VVWWLVCSSLDRVVQVRALRPGNCIVLLGKTLTLAVPLSTQVYVLIPLNSILGVPYNELASYPGGSRIIPSYFML